MRIAIDAPQIVRPGAEAEAIGSDDGFKIHCWSPINDNVRRLNCRAALILTARQPIS